MANERRGGVECCGNCRWSVMREDIHGRGEGKNLKCRRRLEEDGVTRLRVNGKQVCELYAPRTVER